MAIREILQYGNEILKTPCEKVEKIDKDIKELIKDMKDTLYNCDGIGLAAPQIGVLKRVILIDLRDGSDAIILINPEIVEAEGEELSIEGCLSYEGFEGEVLRPEKVIVRGLTPKNKLVEYTADGLLAKAFCHEIDHLDGIMYMDKSRKIYKLK
ncbi:Peptide deformylase 1 [Clostridium sp. N3C]|uniref:peptide deformylase n=1 Tax=Clostridium sp. N3C TaxID=1776758 RepID=UPI00092E095E|nr:peptide deformylase [Clostridium sp. N3C]SCN21665.1 Peptide deformylase 1 [Clostridium sp. N3C]